MQAQLQLEVVIGFSVFGTFWWFAELRDYFPKSKHRQMHKLITNTGDAVVCRDFVLGLSILAFDFW